MTSPPGAGMAERTFYLPRPEEGRQWITPADPSDWDVLHGLAVQRSRRAWWPIKVVPIRRDDDGRRLAPATMPWLASDLVVLDGALASVAVDAVGDDGIVLPLDGPRGSDLWLLHVTRLVAGAIDVQQSDVWHFDDGRIMHINRLVLAHSALRCNARAFRFAEVPTRIVLGGELVSALQAAAPTGTTFLPVQVAGPA